MSDHIPFITSNTSLRIVRSVYSDSELVRISLDVMQRKPSVPSDIKLWIDPGVDGLHALASRDTDSTWYKMIRTLNGYDRIGTPTFTARPDIQLVTKFVAETMDLCAQHRPAWLSVPQLPIVSDASRNRINRELAIATAKWKNSSGFSGRLIMPLLFTQNEQVLGKTQRTPKIREAERCYRDSQADGLWVVDTKMLEEEGSVALRNKRFKAVVALHEEINAKIPSTIRIAGPYWGMNLILWARGLIDYPAIGVGSTYQYYLPGGHSNPPKPKISISPLRRRIGVAHLSSWITKALKILGSDHPAHPELENISKQIAFLRDADNARIQVARFYKGWFDSVALTPQAGRPLALFQDLSKAYALGKSLPTFSETGTVRRPEAVVEPLMLNCL